MALLIAIAVGVFFYFNEKAESCRFNSHLTYWPITLNQWNQDENLRTIRTVFDSVGHRMVNGSEESWDIMWSLEFPFDRFPEKLINLQPHQRINHFPGMTFLTNKKFLAISTAHSKYIPTAFEFPRLKSEFMYYYKMNPEKKFVLKNFDIGGVKIVKYEMVDYQLGEYR